MVMSKESAFCFHYWHIFNIELKSGRNIIEMEGYNDGVNASFGAEIYDADTTTLQGITTEAALSAVTIFTTETFRNDQSKIFDLGQSSGLKCPEGFALSKCDGVETCVAIFKETATPPCSGTPTEITVCECEDVYTEINPLDFLDKHPSEVNVKSDMDKMIVSNLIDAKSRQVLGGYPLLWAFYELYLNVSNCGLEFSGKYDYNNLFEFTDLIGDYWTDLIEQVVPATTIWDGCQNSGKIYRNNIFDQPKYNYKRYSLNYFFENTDGVINGTNCTLEGVTSESIGEKRLCVDLTEELVNNDCLDQIKDLQWKIDNTKVSESVKDGWRKELKEKIQECEEKTKADNIISGYYPATQHNKVFITQIYDTNEYEGDITVVGDSEWDKEQELINDCSETF
jgi:hypothetical protein